MKNLSQFPRKISAKFCYGLEFSDRYENETQAIEDNENLTEELSLKDVQSTAPTFTEKEIAEADKADAETLTRYQEEINSLPGEKNEAARQDIEAEVTQKPVKPKKRGFLAKVSQFFGGNKEFNEKMENAKNLGDKTTAEIHQMFPGDNSFEEAA